MSDWKEYKLGEVVTFQRGHDLPKDKMVDGDIPVAGSNGVIGFHNEYTLNGPGVTIGRSGNIGIPHYYPKAYWAHNTVLYIKDFKGNDPKFMYYLLKTMDFTQLNTGSAVPSLNRNHIHELPVSVPSIDEQRRIASILTSLDDKIDLLRRENATLEAMAETLFRQWFVVEAKEEWEEKPLSSIAIFLNGLACQKYPAKNGIDKLPVLKIRELSSGIGSDSDWATTEVGDEYIVHAGDVIFAWSASLMVKIWDGEDCILNQHLFKVTSDKYPKWFYYFWCKHHLNEFISIAQSHATTMGHIKRGDLDTAMVLIPSDDELLSMTVQMEGLLKKMENNNEQINTLVQTRDRLLPRLMGGELMV
ncbi:MAG: restriction endonuclease subunit S [Bacteroidales bacterium]|nr:restriction endonuclease subunit S [Bacteroidales bacterium]